MLNHDEPSANTVPCIGLVFLLLALLLTGQAPRLFDEILLLGASPLLELVLPPERFRQRFKRLGVHEPDRTPPGRVSRTSTGVVRPRSRLRITGVARVQRPVGAAHDIDEVHVSATRITTLIESREA